MLDILQLSSSSDYNKDEICDISFAGMQRKIEIVNLSVI